MFLLKSESPYSLYTRGAGAFMLYVGYATQRYSSYKLQPKAFKLLLNFLPNGSHKTTLGFFEILKIEIVTTFFRFR